MRQIQPDVVLVDLDDDEASAPWQGQDPRSLQSDLVPPVPVIALADPQGRGKAFAQGFRMVLIKPVEAVELVAAIASVTERLG